MELKLFNYDMTKEVAFDHTSYVLNSKDLGSAEIKLATYKGANQIGEMVVNRTVGTRDISIVGFILAGNADEMREKKRFLQNVVNPLQNFWIVVDGKYKLEVSPDNTIEYGTSYAENNKWLAKFNITGVATNPCFIPINPVINDLSISQGGFIFPLVATEEEGFNFGTIVHRQISNIKNNGQFAVGIKATITARLDGITNPFIENPQTGEKITVNCTLNRNDTLTINTRFGEKSVVYNDNTSLMYLVDITSDWVNLDVGNNYLTFGADANEDGLVCLVEYNPHFLEV